MRIGMLSSDWGDFISATPGGCTWVRMFTPAEVMVEKGMDVFIGEYGWNDEQGFVVIPVSDRLTQGQGDYRGPIKKYSQCQDNIDVVIMKLWMWYEAKDYIRKAQALGQTIIIDIDDWFHGLPTTNIAFHTTHPDRDAKWNRNHMLQSYGEVDGLITSTNFLFDYYKKFNKNTYHVKNSVNPNYFTRRHDSAGYKPTVGWVGIMLWRQGDIEELSGWLGSFLDKHDLRFHHAGLMAGRENEFAEFAKIDPERVSGTSGCSPQFYGNILMPIDIGIVPLNKLPFNDAKSSIKGMEYAITGIPFVAQASPEYKILHEDGAGNVARKPAEWIKHMERLIDPEVRRQQSIQGYNVVMEKYNIYSVVDTWIDTIEKIHASNPRRRNV